MLRAAPLMLLAAVCAAVAGCGGDDGATASGPSPVVSPADAVRLGAVTLRPADFPDDWTKTVVEPPRLRCAADNPYNSDAASSASRLFEQGDRAVQQAVWVFRDARTAARVFGQTEVRSTRSCLRRTIEQQALRRREGSTVKAMKVIGHQDGPGRRHVRLAGEGHTVVQTALGEADSIVRVVTDVDVARVGRSISLVVMMSTTEPFASDTRRDLLDLARQRLGRFAERRA